MPAIRHLRASALLVVAVGAALGFFALRTWVNPLPNQYAPDFAGARWIEPADNVPNGYFRKKIYLDEAPRRAWIQIAATDAFDLYINGKRVAKNSFLSMRASGLYDVTGELLAGKNVIAVAVSRLSFPGAAQVCIRLGIEDTKPGGYEILSDDTWKALSVPAGVQGSILWKATRLDDTSWPNAKAAQPRDALVQPLDFNPAAFRQAPVAQWIGTQSPDAVEARFASTIALPHGVRETWLQVCATGSFELFINSQLVAQKPSAGAWIEMLDVTRWFHPGGNDVLVRVRPVTGTPALFVQALAFGRDGAIALARSDRSWRWLDPQPGAAAAWKPVSVLADYGGAPWGYMKKRPATLQPLPFDEWRDAWRWFATGAVAISAVVALWFAFGKIGARVTGLPLAACMRRDALAHAPAAPALAFFLLLANDVRFHENRWYQPSLALGIAALLLLSKLAMLAMLALVLAPHAEVSTQPRFHKVRWARVVALALIVMAGFIARVVHLTDISLDHDELSLIRMSHGVLTRGYPHDMTGDQNRNLTTYEATTYPLALAGFLSRWSEAGVRMPAVFFGTLTIAVIGLCGARMFGWGAGLLAAAIYAVMPSAIQWARNAFWPQQTECMAALTVWFFYEAIRSKTIDRRFATLASCGILLTYLSWEGSGFILPTLGIALIVMRWGDWSWIKNGHLWRCFMVVSAAVVAQLSYRTLNSDPYMMVGPGLSDLKFPSLFFLDPMFDPTFYVINFLHPENHLPLTLLSIAAVIFFWRDFAVRYVALVLGIFLVCYTAFLSVYAVRYAHWFLPLLVLLAAAGAAKMFARVAAMASSRREALVSGAATAGFVVLLVAASGSIGLKCYRLSSSPGSPIFRTRDGIYQFDYRSASRFVKERARPGDIVIPNFPHTFVYYAGSPGDYFLTTLLAKRMLYDTMRGVPRFTDRFSGNPVIRDMAEFQDVLNRGKRVWIIAVPTGSFANINDPALAKLLVQRGEVVYESYNAQVFLCRGTETSKN
jgi:dolichyl-phosphate-mannose-protein mannosyltransferase